MQAVTVARNVALCCALAACAKKTVASDVDPSRDTNTALALQLGSCNVTLIDAPFDFQATSSSDGTLTVEALRPDGISVVILRETLLPNQSTPVRIPANTLAAGVNTIILSSYGKGEISQSQRFTLDARTPVAGASSVDADGDCYSPEEGDCNDASAAINPGVKEKCTNRIDDNCDGLIDFADPACNASCADSDGDGYPAASCGGPDCNDSDASVHPMAMEQCNGADDNCNGKIDESFDHDGDGYVACTPVQGGVITWRVAGVGCVRSDCTDCDDNNPTTYPGAFEPCDNKIHDCGGPGNKLSDDDGDGHVNCEDPDNDNDAICDPGSPASLQKACVTPNATDGVCCTLGPGNKPDNCVGARNYWQTDWDRDGIGDACDTCSDLDGDGWGEPGTYDRNHDLAPTGSAIGHPAGAPSSDANTFATSSCMGPSGDCRDEGTAQGRAAFPGNAEVCDGVDNNCDGRIDEGFDKDHDGFTTCGGDCDDLHAAASPSGTEICDGLDNNCNGQFDENADGDFDTYTSCGLIRTTGVPGGTDCNNAVNTIYPGATEACNHVDDNCNAIIDEGFDNDGDGYTTCQNDCNDTAGVGAGVHPGATEICDDIDNNCNGAIDEGCDDDNDNYCDAAMTLGASHSTCSAGGDCNDTDASVNPGAPELSCDHVDNNCSGHVDEGNDYDGDTYLNCPGATWTTVGSCGGPCFDCDDTFASAHPGATEICFNGIDDDCDGVLQDANDTDCCTTTTAVPFVNSANGTTYPVEDFESYDDFEAFYDTTENLLDCVLNIAGTPETSVLRGWERKDFGDWCLDGYDSGFGTNGDISWRVRNKTFFQLENLPLGSKTAGTYGNGGSWAGAAQDGCTTGTGCFSSTALVSPTVQFGSVSLGVKDQMLLEYYRYADHETTGGTTENVPAVNNIRDVGAANARADTCRDGEYVNMLPVAGGVPVGGSWPFCQGTCRIQPTFQNASEAPSWVPATHVNCPLSAQPRDMKTWRIVYANVPTGAVNQRVLFRYNTFDNNGVTHQDDGLYLDNVRFLVCHRP